MRSRENPCSPPAPLAASLFRSGQSSLGERCLAASRQHTGELGGCGMHKGLFSQSLLLQIRYKISARCTCFSSTDAGGISMGNGDPLC
jgi:hypothetical protein